MGVAVSWECALLGVRTLGDRTLGCAPSWVCALLCVRTLAVLRAWPCASSEPAWREWPGGLAPARRAPPREASDSSWSRGPPPGRGTPRGDPSWAV